MIYQNIRKGTFISRPNRFIAHVVTNGELIDVHVKNTGRCRELLLVGALVVLQKGSNPNRKTEYDLISVYKEGFGWVNIDSQAPNEVMEEWLGKQDYNLIRPELAFGSSRIDFYLEKGKEKFLIEVKGCTLEKQGIGYFPDAPTARGTKHLKELTEALKEGFHCVIAFVIPMDNITEVRPNEETDPAFAKAYQSAKEAGVEVWFMPCHVTENSLEIVNCHDKNQIKN